MPNASALRAQIETALADRIPSALTLAPRALRPVASTGIRTVDELLCGGLPLGAITEVVGPECSGRTSFALSFVAEITRSEKVCAWIDVSDALHPESAAAVGVDLTRLLWVRCGVPSGRGTPPPSQSSFVLPKACLTSPTAKRGLHGGGFGPHPRGEVKGLAQAVSGLLKPEMVLARSAEPSARVPPGRPVIETRNLRNLKAKSDPVPGCKPWQRLEQALRAADLLLQAGGFSAVVLDMSSIAPEHVSRVPLATWFRYRAAAERTQTSVLLLTQHACVKSSAGLVLRLHTGHPLVEERTVFTGLEHRVEVLRQQGAEAHTNVVTLRKPPQRESGAGWCSRTAWAGC